MPRTDLKLPLSEKLGYALGDAAANFVLQMQIVFLMVYYTDVYGITGTVNLLGLPISIVAAIFAVSRVIDACNDLVMGSLADRTMTRWGKFRPWIFWSAIPLGVTSYLVFAGPQFDSNGRIWYAMITLNLMIIAYGANNIPYSALGGVISDDPDERVSVAAWRFNFAMAAALFVQTYTLDLVNYFGQGDKAEGYRMAMMVWAALAVACSLTSFFTTKERIAAVPLTNNTSLRADLAVLLANPAWRILAIASFIICISQGIRGSIMIYYFQYVLERQDLFGKFNAVGMIAAMIGIYFSKSLGEKFGKRNAFSVGLILSALLSTGFYLLDGGNTPAIFVMQVVFQVVCGATVPLMWGMIADVADLTEWQFGRRITALTFAATLFFFKIGQGVGTALTASMLQTIGYEPNVEQTPAATAGIRFMVSILPSSLFFLSGVVVLWYTISRAMEREMTLALRQRREQLMSQSESADE